MALWKYSRYINNLTFIYTVDFLVIMAQYLKVSLDLTIIFVNWSNLRENLLNFILKVFFFK